MFRGHSYAINVSPDILTWCYGQSKTQSYYSNFLEADSFRVFKTRHWNHLNSLLALLCTVNISLKFSKELKEDRKTVGLFCWVVTRMISNTYTVFGSQVSVMLNEVCMKAFTISRSERTLSVKSACLRKGTDALCFNCSKRSNNDTLLTKGLFTGYSHTRPIHSFFFIRMLFFRPRLNILSFLPILGWKFSCIILKL